jgi:hypothetical protein
MVWVMLIVKNADCEMSERVIVFNTNLAIIQLLQCYGENKLIFNEMMMMRSALF